MNRLSKIAFTLIELLVVIAIIGILSGLIVVTMSGVTQKATIAKAQVFSNSLRNSLMFNLISEWKLDENTGTSIADSWSGGNTGTLNGAIPTWKTGADCISGSCIQFGGADGYIGCGSATNLDSLSKVTVSAWVKVLGNPASARFIAGNYNNGIGGYFLGHFNNKFIFFVKDSNSYSYSSGAAIQNQWANIVYTADNTVSGTTVIKSYLNGAYDNTTTRSVNIGTASLAFIIAGSRYYDYLNGLVDEVRVFNEIITTSQIKEQYYSGLNKMVSNGSISIEEYNQRLGEISLK